MAAKAKIVSGGKPKATKTYDCMSVKKKETAAKTKRNEGGKQTSPDLSNSIIEKSNDIRSIRRLGNAVVRADWQVHHLVSLSRRSDHIDKCVWFQVL